MFGKSLILIVMALAVGLAGSTAKADWLPSDGWNMHFPQIPSVFGWDVNATSPSVLADAWICTETDWVRDIHFWGSWLNGLEGQVVAFQMSIHADIPANPPDVPYGKPGALLWEKQVSNFHVAIPDIPPGPVGWYDPSAGTGISEDHSHRFQYNVFLDAPDWFWQTEGTVYWLVISAVVAEPGQTQWGWTSSQDHWSDAATWAFSGEYIWIDTWEPPDYMQSLDLAFVIGPGEACCDKPGDCNDDGVTDVGDAIYLVNYVFKGGPPPPCLDEGDANFDCNINISDAVYLISYIFRGGQPPECGCVE